MSQAVVVLGTSGHARAISGVLALLDYDIIGYIGQSSAPYGKPLLGDDEQLPEIINSLCRTFALGIGDNRVRERVAKTVKGHGGVLQSIIGPGAVVSPVVKLGTGSILMPNVVINNDSTVGEGSLLNTSCSVDHDCIVGDFVHISVGTRLCGNVRVGHRTFVGAGAIILPGIRIGADAVIGAGAVVTKNIQDGQVVYGSPARQKTIV